VSAPKLRIESAGINGLWPMLPTPAKEGASDWRSRDTVDLDETARMVEALIEAGVDGLMSLGTYGECHSLTLRHGDHSRTHPVFRRYDSAQYP